LLSGRLRTSDLRIGAERVDAVSGFVYLVNRWSGGRSQTPIV